ncbi:MAG: hypothetical protein D6744_08545, partial [Planctomycetota bacterium]
MPVRCPKPILSGVRIEASGGWLHLAASDGEVKLLTQVEARGNLPGCVVSCAELGRRARASKGDACALSLKNRPQRLCIKGGRVEHALPTLPAEEFPPIPDRHHGDTLTIDAEQLHTQLTAVSHAVAPESTRYAIDGVLLESDDDGARLVATDGRRLVVADLRPHETTLRENVIIPAVVARLVRKLAARESGLLTLAVEANQNEAGKTPFTDLYAAGCDWLLSAPKGEGSFPRYRDVMPSSRSKFLIDRRPLIETLKEIGLAVSLDAPVVYVDLSPRRIRLSASSPEAGESSAKLPARFLGGGDRTIHTAFKPAYLLDACNALDGEQIIIDIGQNGLGCGGKVLGKPALLYAHDNSATRCLVMP